MSDILGALKVVKLNGVAVNDFKNFKFKERKRWKEVMVNQKQKVFPLPVGYGFTMDFVPDANGSWENLEEKIKDATVVVLRADGAKMTLTGVYGNAGEEATDPENETVVPFDCIVTGSIAFE